MPTNQDQLLPNESLGPDQSISSPNGRYTFVYQSDGNLVLYRNYKNYDRRALWASSTDGRVVERCIMQGDGNLVIYGPGNEYVWDTSTDGHPESRLVVQDDGNVVICDPAGTPLWATNTNVFSVRVPGFLPSVNGFQFPNSFPNAPDLQINVLGANVAIGNSANGLCGGMIYAVRDLFEAGRVPPPIKATVGPSSGPLFDFIVRRLFDSFELPSGPLRYLFLMNTTLPDHETSASEIGLAPHGRAWVMINDEWPKIKVDLDAGRLSPMGLIYVKSLNPGDMGLNHQVLAYGYELEGEELRILIYDPNCPGNDNVAIELNISHPKNTSTAKNTCLDKEVHCFFRPNYNFVDPPADLTTIPVERRLSVRNNTSSDQTVRVFNPGDSVMLIAVTAGEFLVRSGTTTTWVFQNGMSQVKLTANGRPLGLANPGDRIVISQDDSVLVRNVTDSPIRARFYNQNDRLMWVTLPDGDRSISAHQDFRFAIPSDLTGIKIVIQGQTFAATLGDVVVFGA